MKVWLNRQDNLSAAIRLKELGIGIISVPISRLIVSDVKTSSDEYDIVIITSANALPQALRYDASFITVGEKSARVLRDAGRNLLAVYHNVSDLISEMRRSSKKKVLYLRGRHVTHSLAEAFGCDELVVYEIAKRSLTDSEILDVQKSDCVFVYSQRNAAMLKDVLAENNIDASSMTAICISEAVKEALHDSRFKRIIASMSADEDGMIYQLRSL